MGIRRCSLMYRLPASHGENRGSGPLGSANEIKPLMQVDRLVSNNCPINVYGQAWTACSFLDWTTCAVRVALPLLAPPCGWRSPNDLDVTANAVASAGSYGRRIERAEGFAQGKRCANRYRRSPAPKFQRSTPLALFLRPNELALDPWRVRKLRKEPLAAEHSGATAFDGPDGGTG